MAIDIEIDKWRPFRDALRKPEKDFFEDMLLRSKLYASAGSMTAWPNVLEVMVLSILLDHHIHLFQLAAEIEKIKNPGSPKPPESIEKILQQLTQRHVTWQTTLETTPQPDSN